MRVKAVLRIQDVHLGSRIWIFSSQIQGRKDLGCQIRNRIRIKEFNIFNLKKLKPSSRKNDTGYSSRIPDPGSQVLIPGSRIPDPKSQIPDPGSGLATPLLSQGDIFKIQNILRLEPVELPAINSTLRVHQFPLRMKVWGNLGGLCTVYSTKYLEK
jgi:hypothetical protein